MEIQSMQLSDMDSLMRLKNDEGWNQLEADWELLINYPDSPCYVAKSSNRIVGSVTAINYSNTVAWIGMMLVEKAFRGRGISRLLMQATINDLKGCQSIKLDATPAGFPVYEKMGFEDELTLLRMVKPRDADIHQLVENPGESKSGGVDSIQMEDLSEIVAYDHKVFGANRKELIEHLYKGAPTLARCIRNKNRIIGFCLGRAGSGYTQVGPLYASSPELAQTLLRAVLNQLEGRSCVVDIHSDKKELTQELIQAGFSTVRSFQRMFLAENNCKGKVDQQYLISGPELG